MPIVYNTTTEEVKVQAFGNHFTFKSGQMKLMQDDIAHFLGIDKAYLGLVTLPESVLEDRDSEESKKLVADAKTLGINNRVRYLTGIIKNLEVSLRRDLDIKNIKMDATSMVTDGELNAYRELAKYKQSQDNENLKKAAEIAELQKAIGSTGE